MKNEMRKLQCLAWQNEEWWHFDYRDWRQYRILDIPLEAIQ
jgi:D-alanyl-D-alanine dipeptidase